MALDLVIKNGTVIDGTGLPRHRADIGIKDGKIVEKGRVADGAARTIDADGLVVAPGIIDLHTHYDPQLPWEKLGTSSIWHGITTVMIGNCGLTLAPLRPQDREPMLGIFGRVEELALSTLRAAIPWNWETFGEYMDAIDQGLGLNVLPMVGHNALRLSAMGEAAGERAATEDEIVKMQQLLRESLEAGAWGWSTTISPTHVGPTGEPVPSRLADDHELIAFAQTLREFNSGSIALIPRRAIFGLGPEDQSTLYQLSVESGRPVVWNGYNYRWHNPQSAFDDLAYMEDAARRGAQIFALLRVTPLDRRVSLQRSTYFNGLALWRDIMELPLEERAAAFANPDSRPALRHAFDNPDKEATRGQIRPPIRPAALYVRSVKLDKNQAFVGRPVTELAAEQGKHVADFILDLALEEGLETEFQAKMEMPEDEAPKGQLMQSLHALPYQSDAGAHVNSDCTAGESTYVLSHWVREKNVLSLEEAIRRMTMVPAQIAGLTDRGIIREGMAADLMVFDPDTIECQPKELVQDMPAGDTRYIQRATGIPQVIVGGQVVLEDGRHTGALPGRVLRNRRQ